MGRYVSSDGTVYDSRPWDFQRLIEVFWGIIAFFTMFGQTLIEPLMSSLRQNSSPSSSGRKPGSGGGGGGGGFGGFGGGPGSGPGSGGRPGGPNIRTVGDIRRDNTVSFCPGGACGR